ncbi:MAG: hypothetical protein HW401_210 [Parcubacteria group bacterium]|nr:hypothetical protein [Parcubacteria group bacterium]
MKTVVGKDPGIISLSDEMHPSCLGAGEYGIITKSVYTDLVGTLVISAWYENGVMLVSLKNAWTWSFPRKLDGDDNDSFFKVKKVVIDEVVCH